GGNENSARLRVVRALEKLRGFFQRRGVIWSSGLLSAALLVPSSQAASPALVSSVIGVVAGNCPASVAAFAQAILRRTWWRRWRPWVGGLMAVFILAMVFTDLVRDDPGRIASQARATALAIDGALSSGDSDAFIAHVHFRNSEQEQFRPVLAAFIRASVRFRQQVRKSFGAQPVRMQIWLWSVEQLFHRQPHRGEHSLRAGLV